MATYNLNVTASVDLLGSDISGSQSTDFAIANPLSGSSYFTFETVRNSDGFYDSSSPKNMAGTYTLGAGLAGVVKSDYIASVVVEPGGGTLTFVPTNYISGSSLNLRGTSAPPLPVSGGFDIDAQAFFDRVTTAGGSLSATEQTAVNTLVVQMKADGIWSKMKAIYPMVGASAAACAQNLKSSSFTGTFTSGWTFASTGVQGNGTSAYMNTTLTPSSQLSLNNSHLSFYSRTDSPGNGMADIGSFGTNSNWTLIEVFSNVFYNLINQNTLGSTNSMTTTLGHFIGSRTASNAIEGYRNGTSFGTHTTSSNQLSDRSIYLAAMNNGATALYNSSRQYAFASIGDGLTDTEASDFYTAVQAFQTTLNRQV